MIICTFNAFRNYIHWDTEVDEAQMVYCPEGGQCVNIKCDYSTWDSLCCMIVVKGDTWTIDDIIEFNRTLEKALGL